MHTELRVEIVLTGLSYVSATFSPFWHSCSKQLLSIHCVPKLVYPLLQITTKQGSINRLATSIMTCVKNLEQV